MKYIINELDKAPAYLQLYKMLKNDITANVYPYKTKLPSKRTLALESGVSIITVEHAYDLLLDEGYIESLERSGYYVIFSKNLGFMDNPEKQHKPVIKNNYSSNVTFPFSVLTKTMRNVINIYGEKILSRSDNLGTLELRTELKKYLRRSKGLNVETNQIIIGSGSEYLYSLIVKLFGQNKKYAIEDPSYQKIEDVYKSLGIKYEKLKLGTDGIKSSELKRSHANILHISPYRSYPSGVSASISKKHEYLKWAELNNAYIVEDDFESEFSILKKPEESLYNLSINNNVIYMNSFSKTISPSIRCSYLVLPKKLLTTFNDKLGFMSCTVPTYIQYVLAELISSGDFERHINRVRRNKRKELSKD